MDTPPKTLTYTTVTTGPSSGRTRRVQVSLPYIAAIADDPHYQPPPIEPRASGPYMTKRLVRAALALDPAYSRRLQDKVGYAATVHRIESEGF